MNRHTRKNAPSFLRQGLLILLPVALLAAVGIWALQTDRAAVERQAQARTRALSAAVSAEIETFLQPVYYEGDAFSYPAHVQTLSVSPSNTLYWPTLGHWPPTPMPLPADLSPLLRSNKLEQWQAAGTSFNAQNWSQVIELLDVFLDGERAIAEFTGAHWRSNLSNERLDGLALFRRAVALEQSGDTERAIAAYQRLIDAFPPSSEHEYNTRSESGLPMHHLAARKILDLAQDRPERLPEAWRKDPYALIDRLETDGSPFGEELRQRLRALQDQLASPAQRNWLPAKLKRWEEIDDRRRLASEAVDAQSGVERPWPARFWVDGSFRWLAVEQRMPADFKNTLGQRIFVAFTENRLTDGLSAIVKREDRAGEFEVRVELAGRHCVLGRKQPPLWSEPITPQPADIPMVVTAILADPDAYFASQRRRQWLFSGLLLAAAGACVTGFLSARRAFLRQLRLNEMKSNFVSSVSHELRAPIASVRLMAESLERGKVQDAPRRNEYYRFIGQECRRLSSLIENVLDFSRIEQGRKQYEFEPTDLTTLVQTTVKLMDTYAAEKGVKLVLVLPDSQPSSLNHQPSLDGKAIQQALINLIDNAIKHSPKDATVTVGVECGAGSPQPAADGAMGTSRPTDFESALRLFVEDRGEGIPPEEHEKIFERFYRRGTELRRETQGVGIGLSIVKHVVEAHGGRVLVRSAVGQGSRFTIELPTERNVCPAS